MNTDEYAKYNKLKTLVEEQNSPQKYLKICGKEQIYCKCSMNEMKMSLELSAKRS